jgi:hypothetical protein
VRLLPAEDDDLLYRIKSGGEPIDRIATECKVSSR